jgi:transketolase
MDQQGANTLRGLAIDAIQAANSGHPGMPMGTADIAWLLWSEFLRFDASAPQWPDRDRFVLSAGLGSMLQYGLLHLFGYDLSIDDLKQFRQLHSKTPGHPEYGHTDGVETTTGPLGQGIANGVGMALAEARQRTEFTSDLVDHWTWVIAGDGCMQEGVASEAASLAGHWGLERLVVLYDSNHISIDGRTELAFTEDVAARYAAYGWRVLHAAGHDFASIRQALAEAHRPCGQPTLIVCDTTIGRGSPKLAGSHKVHGAPLGPDEIRATKAQLGLDPEQFFAVAPEVYQAARAGAEQRKAVRLAWERRAQGEAGQKLLQLLAPVSAQQLAAVQWPTQAPGAMLSTRKAGEQVLAALAKEIPQLFCGSADLGHSTFAVIPGATSMQKDNYAGRNVHWGIREHAMGSVANGLAVSGGHLPIVSTFLVFHDYMRPAVRLAALMGLQVGFVYTHDSVFVGEDGPTHQPVETLAAMRVIPGLATLRPADLAETCAAYQLLCQRTRAPTALALTRQNLPELQRPAGFDLNSAVAKGAYVLSAETLPLELVLAASGSEVHLAVAAQAQLAEDGIGVRVVSVPSLELFDAQPQAYRDEVVPPQARVVTIEAGSTLPWRYLAGRTGACIGIDRFGASAPDKVLAKVFGLTVENLVATAMRLLQA